MKSDLDRIPSEEWVAMAEGKIQGEAAGTSVQNLVAAIAALLPDCFWTASQILASLPEDEHRGSKDHAVQVGKGDNLYALILERLSPRA